VDLPVPVALVAGAGFFVAIDAGGRTRMEQSPTPDRINS